MGFYSEYDIDRQTRCGCEDSTTLDSLQYRLSDLKDRLLALDQWLSVGPLDPMYDRFFYEDHIVEPYEIPKTAQGLLEAISIVEEQIENKKVEELRRNMFVISIFQTGATPSGQYALPIHMFSPYELFETAA